MTRLHCNYNLEEDLTNYELDQVLMKDTKYLCNIESLSAVRDNGSQNSVQGCDPRNSFKTMGLTNLGTTTEDIYRAGMHKIHQVRILTRIDVARVYG